MKWSNPSSNDDSDRNVCGQHTYMWFFEYRYGTISSEPMIAIINYTHLEIKTVRISINYTHLGKNTNPNAKEDNRANRLLHEVTLIV